MRSEFEFILVGGAESVWLLCVSLVGRRCGSEAEDGVSCPPPRPPASPGGGCASWAAGVILHLPDVLRDPRSESKLTTGPVEVMALLLVVVSAPVARPFLLLFASFI